MSERQNNSKKICLPQKLAMNEQFSIFFSNTAVSVYWIHSFALEFWTAIGFILNFGKKKRITSVLQHSCEFHLCARVSAAWYAKSHTNLNTKIIPIQIMGFLSNWSQIFSTKLMVWYLGRSWPYSLSGRPILVGWDCGASFVCTLPLCKKNQPVESAGNSRGTDEDWLRLSANI
jgi:hypothetical protein